MTHFLYLVIAILGISSYVVGIRDILHGVYSPSVFSRLVWMLISINSFAGVIISKGSTSSIVLVSVFLIGNMSIGLLSVWKGTRSIGKLEYICMGLLFVSVFVWFFFYLPILNLLIGLIAHFIGGLPTYKKVWTNPSGESSGFWSLFFFASALSVVAAGGQPFSAIIFPLYFMLFDGSLWMLSLRGKDRYFMLK
jgi:hypothetical protein